MPSELQRVARGLVDCFDEIPRVVDHLLGTAARCRENAQVALLASRGQATVAAQQLDAAARACEAAAHFLSMAPPKARGWAESLTGTAGRSTNRPSSDSADRNKSTSGTGVELRVKRLVVAYEDVEPAEDNEPPVITAARKAFEKFRKAHEKDASTEDREPLELEITVTETGELIIEERDEKEEEQRAGRLTRDFEIDVELTEAVKNLLDSIAESEDEKYQHATLTITTDHLEATFDQPDDRPPEPLVVDIELPDRRTEEQQDPDSPRRVAIVVDPGAELGALGDDFEPGVFDPHGRFLEKEIRIGSRLGEEGWRIDARRADHSSGEKNPDALVRKHRDDEGAIVEFKTQDVGDSNAVKRSMLRASGQALKAASKLEARGEVVIDGRKVGLSEETALRSFRRAVGQPRSTLAPVVHVILGDGRLVTFTKEQ